MKQLDRVMRKMKTGQSIQINKGQLYRDMLKARFLLMIENNPEDFIQKVFSKLSDAYLKDIEHLSMRKDFQDFYDQEMFRRFPELKKGV